MQSLEQLREQIDHSPRMSGQLYGSGGPIARAPVQSKPKEERIQTKPKEELRQRRAADVPSVPMAADTVTQLYKYGKGTTRDVTVKGNGTNECSFEECLSNTVEYKTGDQKRTGSQTTNPAKWADWLTVKGKSRNATQMHSVNARWGGLGGQKDGNIFPGSPAENSHHLHEGETDFDKICFGGKNGTTALGDFKYECTAAPDYLDTVDVSKGPVDVEDPTVEVEITDTKAGKSLKQKTITDGIGLTFQEG